MATALLRRQGNLVELSVDGGRLPGQLASAAESELTYTHRRRLGGREAYDEGVYRPVAFSQVPLYRYDDRGRLVFSRGFQPRLTRLCRRLGYAVEAVCLDPPHPRPQAYEYDFERLFDRMDLLPRQDVALEAIISGECGGLIVSPPGTGKTQLMVAVALACPHARIHVVTRRKDVMKGIHRRLTQHVPDVGMVGAGKRRWGRVTCVTADSLHWVDHTPQHEPDLVLFDEVHEAAAPTYSAELAKYQRARMFGFTATPEGRFDGADLVIEGLFGERLFEMYYPEAVELGLVVPIEVEWIHVRLDDNPASGLNGTLRERCGVWRNAGRNALIAEKARAYRDEDQVLVMVSSVEHAFHLKRFLPEYRLCYDTVDARDYRAYINDGLATQEDEPMMTSLRREQMRQGFETGRIKKVICTDVWSTGVDFVALSVLIRADARSSEILDVQAPGRVSRLSGATGKRVGRIVDCMDHFDHGFLRRSQGRRRVYRKMGWEPQPDRRRLTTALL